MLQNLIIHQINICAMHNSKQFIKHIKNNATPVSCVIHGVQTVMTMTTPKHVKNISRGQATAFRSKILNSDKSLPKQMSGARQKSSGARQKSSGARLGHSLGHAWTSSGARLSHLLGHTVQSSGARDSALISGHAYDPIDPSLS